MPGFEYRTLSLSAKCEVSQQLLSQKVVRRTRLPLQNGPLLPKLQPREPNPFADLRDKLPRRLDELFVTDSDGLRLYEPKERSKGCIGALYPEHDPRQDVGVVARVGLCRHLAAGPLLCRARPKHRDSLTNDVIANDMNECETPLKLIQGADVEQVHDLIGVDLAAEDSRITGVDPDEPREVLGVTAVLVALGDASHLLMVQPLAGLGAPTTRCNRLSHEVGSGSIGEAQEIGVAQLLHAG